MVIADAAGAREITGTIYVPDFDHDTVEEETRVIDAHTIAPYMKPGIMWIENGEERTATVATDSPLYRVVGKKVKALVHPDEPNVAKPVETSLRWDSVKTNVRTIIIVVLLMVALWFRQIFLIAAVVPAGICVWALGAELSDRESHRRLSQNMTEAPYRIVAETRERISAGTTDSKGRRSPASYEFFHYLQFEYPAEEYHTVKVRRLTGEEQARYKTIFFNAKNPQDAALEKPKPMEFWSRSMIVAFGFGAFALLLIAAQIALNRSLKKRPLQT